MFTQDEGGVVWMDCSVNQIMILKTVLYLLGLSLPGFKMI